MAKKFKLPETLVGLTVEDLATLRTDARAEIDAINSVDGDLDAEQLDSLESLLGDIDAIDAQSTELTAAAEALEARRAALRERAAGLDPVEESVEEPVEAVEETPEAVVEEPEAVEVEEPVVEEREPVLAAGTRRNTVAVAKKKAPAVIIPKKEEPVGSVSTITAAANVPDFGAGDVLADMSEVAKAFSSRVQGRSHSESSFTPGVRELSPNFSRQGVARIKRDNPTFAIKAGDDVEAQFAIINEAAKESRLEGGSIIAAGGWCAPSDINYGFLELETTAGFVEIPEVTAKRGGIQFTKGPDLMTIFGDANAGFTQTEAQAEAGQTKPCYAIECPPWEEVRLDAVGFCVTAPLLTNAAYPELIRRTLNLIGIGHQRRKSASTINRIKGLISQSATLAAGAEGFSGAVSVLTLVEVNAFRIRQSLAMDPNATIEGIAPYWLRASFRAELANSLGVVDRHRITDADVDSYFAARGIRLQYVYDNQMLTSANTANWTRLPETVTIELYPAGAFVRLVNDVINIDAVYDHDLLTQNTYTAAFFEEGMAVANTGGFGVSVTAPLNYDGATGFPAIGAPAFV